MKKRLFSFALALFFVVSIFCTAIFADESISYDTCTHDWQTPLFNGYSVTIPGTDVSFSVKTEQCSKCKLYKHTATIFVAEFTYYSPLNVDANGLVPTELITYWLNVWYKTFGQNATATRFQAGGGSAGSGVGRHPSGYADDNGTPSVNSNGSFQVVAHALYNFTYSDNPFFNMNWISEGNYIGNDGNFYMRCLRNSIYVCKTVQDGKYSYPDYFSYTYAFDAPIDGLYYSNPSTTLDGFWNNDNWGESQSEKNVVFSEKFTAGESRRFSKFRKLNIYAGGSRQQPYSYTIKVHDLVLNVVPDTVSVETRNNITINNNTWNGNIYTDNSTNLTYIYPQYTTINDSGDTVTNISNNPIIYNNETNQYYTYDTVTNNYYYITYEEPKPSATPAPTWTPGGGSTRGGGVGRTPHDTDSSDWTLHYYILNNRRYDAYYALKKTEVDTEKDLPWKDDKHYISTTQIPIANGEYTISVPDGVYWRVWQWDETSQTLTGLNSSNWHSSNFNFLFNTTGDYIFEFCKSDGSEFASAKDVVLKLKNEKITEYEPGATIVEEPSPSPTPDPGASPTPTPKPGGGTIITPGGGGSGSGGSTSESGNSGSGSSWNPFKWLKDLLEDIIEGILKKLWSLITSIFGFLLWLLSLVGKLFPFIPGSAILALTAGAVIVTIIRIIKFITGR